MLAGGTEAVLSHRSAGALWRVRQWSGRHEVTVPSWRRGSKKILWHTAQLPPDEITVHERIPVTSATRTIFDLASVLEPRELERAMEEANFLRLSDGLSLPDLLHRHPRARGTAALRAILGAADIGRTRTRNDFEEALIALVDEHGLPRPHMNKWIRVGDRWIEADAVWEEQRLIVELDGRSAHLRAGNFESDRARDRAATVAGWRVVRITWLQILREKRAVAADLAALLAEPLAA